MATKPKTKLPPTGKKRGRPAGKPNSMKPWTDAIRRAVARGKKLDALAAALILRAELGDIAALKEIGDRLEGRTVQALAIDPTGGQPATLTVQWLPAQ